MQHTPLGKLVPKKQHWLQHVIKLSKVHGVLIALHVGITKTEVEVVVEVEVEVEVEVKVEVSTAVVVVVLSLGHCL